VLVIEIVPVGFLLFLCLVLTVEGGAAMRFMDDTARGLHAPGSYIRDVLSAPPVPAPAAPEAAR